MLVMVLRHLPLAYVIRVGPVVTIRSSPVFVRADSISTVDIMLPSPNRLEWHSGFVRASRFQRSPFDLLRLVRTTCLHALGAMESCWQVFPVVGTSLDEAVICDNICKRIGPTEPA